MALIDVSELLFDPDFSDTFTYDRRTQTVGSNGRASFTTDAGLPMVGSVQPGGADALQRFPDSARPSDWIKVYTQTILVAHDEVAGVYGDVLNWKGCRYQVRSTDNWSQFGAGYSKVLAELIPVGAP